MPISVRFGGRSLYKPGSYVVTNVDALNNQLLGESGVVIVVGESTGGQPGVIYSFDGQRQMITELIGGHLAEMAQALFDPGPNTGLRGAERVLAIKTNQSTQAALALRDGSAVTQVNVQSRVWGAPGNFTHATIAAGTEGGIVLTGGRDVDPSVGTQQLAEVGRTAGDPNADAWLRVWFDVAETIADRTTATVTYDPNGDSLISAFSGGTTNGNAGTLNFTAGNDGALSTHTIETLLATINTKLGWHAVLLRPDRLKVSAREGDTATTVNVFNTGASTNDWEMMGTVYDLVATINASSVYLTATKPAPPATVQAPANISKTYLTGGTLGTSSSGNIDDALTLAKTVQCRVLVSGFDDDVGAIAIETINAKFATHATESNDVTSRSERSVIVADKQQATRSLLEQALSAINHADVQLVAQNITREDPTGVITSLGPHVLAAAAAGIRAGSPFGTPLTNKRVRATAVTQTGWKPETLSDANALIQKGLLFVEMVPGVGFQFVRDLTTYSATDNDALRAGEIRDEIHRLTFLVRTGMAGLVGQKGLGIITQASAQARLEAILGSVSDPTDPDVLLVAGTDATGAAIAPYRNVTVSVSQDTIICNADVTFAQGVNFVLTTVVATPLRVAA